MAKRKKKVADDKRQYCEIEPKICDGSCGCKNKKGGRK